MDMPTKRHMQHTAHRGHIRGPYPWAISVGRIRGPYPWAISVGHIRGPYSVGHIGGHIGDHIRGHAGRQ